MNDSKKSYFQILKITSLFSGVQLFNVLISIARSKFAAIFIGATGIGIVGVLNSTISVISGLVSLGLDVSAVREIAAFSGKDENKVKRSIAVVSKLTWLTGILGGVITFLIAPWLSELTFGDHSQTHAFMLIAIAVVFNQLTNGNIAILQGLRKLRKLAKATVWASFFSLLVIIPLYYFYGIDGIVPVIIISAILTYAFSVYFSKNYKSKEGVSFRSGIAEGKEMMKLGVVLSLGTLATVITTYLVQIFIANKGGIDQLGLYNATFLIVNGSVGVIFTAMSKDYFPRLSMVAQQKKEMIATVNQQTYISILLLTPIIVGFLTFLPFIIKLLLTKDFLPMTGILTFIIMATLFKAIAWALGYIIVAKGDSRLYLRTELGFNFVLLALCVLGYTYLGLKGLGICYLAYYLLYLLGVLGISRMKYGFRFNKELLQLIFTSVCIITTAYVANTIDNVLLKYIILGVVLITSCIFTIIKLNSKSDLYNEIKERFLKKE